jgi:hypothetical protein
MIAKNGQCYSAIGIVPGCKINKHREGGNYYYFDNVLAECTITPSHTRDEAIASVRQGLTTLSRLVSPYRLVVQAAQNYPKAQLKHTPTEKIPHCQQDKCASSETPFAE